MEVISEAKTSHDIIINEKEVNMADCRDGGHCKYCIRGNDYCN